MDTAKREAAANSEGKMHEGKSQIAHVVENGGVCPDSVETSSVTEQTQSEGNYLMTEEKKGRVVRAVRLKEKLVHVISVTSLILMAYGVLSMHWLLPYYFAVSAPILIFIRLLMYWKYKWQLFLLDFCYFANIVSYIYLWAVPQHHAFFAVVFAFANGPLPWAALVFRNSLVFHSVDSMTSVYIHVLPMFLTYAVRWYPDSISRHWYRDFVSRFDEDVAFMFVWLVAVPFACYVFHTLLYVLIVYAIIRPSEKYLNSFRYLSAKGDRWPAKFLNCLGSKYKFPLFVVFNWVYCVASLLCAVLWYKYFIAHTVFVALVMLIVTWNGSTYYVDVFAIKGFRSDDIQNE